MYLGIDLGDKRCGIAIYVEKVVIPKEIIPRVKIIDSLKKYIKEYKIQTVVVGLPFDLYEKDKKQLEKTQKFIEKLKNIFPEINIEGVDERFSSFEAESILSFMGEKDFFGKKDAISASIILETFLQKNKIH